MSIILTSSQYRDLEHKIGERNNITRVKGKEYKINNALSVTFHSGSKTIPVTHSTWSYVSCWSGSDTSKIFGIDDQRLREEYKFTSGYYEFQVNDRIISDVNKLTVSFSLSGAKYQTTNNNIVNSGNWTSNYSVFASIISNSNKTEDVYLDGTDSYLSHDRGMRDNWLNSVKTDPISYPSQYCYVRFIRKQSINDVLTYTFRVYYGFVTLTGWNRVHENFWGTNYYTNTCNAITSMSFTVKGLTVDAEESDVEIGSGSKLLELQTNELMQTATDSNISLFESTAQTIINNFSSNRAVITFKMVNNIKYTINGETRFLRAGDKIKLKDMNGKYISEYQKTTGGSTVDDGNDFEIIKIENCFNGIFYRNITVREVLREDQ